MKKNRKRNFDEVVRGIASAEKDVDKVLKAAKLARNEKPGWDDVDFAWLFAYSIMGIVMLTICIVFIIMVLKS